MSSTFFKTTHCQASERGNFASTQLLGVCWHRLQEGDEWISRCERYLLFVPIGPYIYTIQNNYINLATQKRGVCLSSEEFLHPTGGQCICFFQGTILHCIQTHTKKLKNLKAKYLKYRLHHVVVSRKLNNWTISNAIISSFFRLNKMQSTPFLLVSHFLAPDETAGYSTSRLHLKRTTEIGQGTQKERTIFMRR